MALQARAFVIAFTVVAGSMTCEPVLAQFWGDRPSGGWGWDDWGDRPELG